MMEGMNKDVMVSYDGRDEQGCDGKEVEIEIKYGMEEKYVKK